MHVGCRGSYTAAHARRVVCLCMAHAQVLHKHCALGTLRTPWAQGAQGTLG